MNNEENKKEDKSIYEQIKTLNKEQMAEFLSYVYNSDALCERCIDNKEGCYNEHTQKAHCYSYIIDLLDKHRPIDQWLSEA